MRTKLIVLGLLTALVVAGVLVHRSLMPEAPPAPGAGGKFVVVDAAERALDGAPAVLPQAPSALRPDRHADKARLARGKVLRRMSARTHPAPGQGYAHRFTEPGRYEITAVDDSGGYDRISVSVR